MREIGYILGVDLGQTFDYTAVSLVKHLLDLGGSEEERRRDAAVAAAARFGIEPFRNGTSSGPVNRYQVLTLHRYARGTTYTSIVDSIAERLRRPELNGRTKLVLDRTGVGRPVFDLFQSVGAKPIGITFSGGNEPSRQDGGWIVPKADLVGALQSTMGTERLKVSADIAEWPTLRQEMQDLEVRMTPTGHAQFAADWRRKDSHDDLLFSLAIALWYGETVKESVPQFYSGISY